MNNDDFNFIQGTNKSLEELLVEYEYFANANHANVWKKEILGKYIDPTQALTILELGTGIGSSAVWMSENFCRHSDSIIHTAGIDPKKGIDNYARQRLESYSNIVYYNEYGNSVMRKLKLNYDFIYIDGTHKYLSVLNDAKYALKYLKESGIIVFDDYSNEWPGVVKAVDEFVKEFKLITKPIGDTQIMVRR